MWEDLIVAEVHRTREKLWAEQDFDVAAMFAAMRKRQAQLGDRLVSESNRVEPGHGVDRNGPSSPVPLDVAPAT